MGDAPYLRDERVVASSPGTQADAPEYHMRAVLRREFHSDSPSIRLVIEGPFAEATEYWDSHQVELVIELLQRSLPRLREAEQGLEGEWKVWRDEAE